MKQIFLRIKRDENIIPNVYFYYITAQLRDEAFNKNKKIKQYWNLGIP